MAPEGGGRGTGAVELPPSSSAPRAAAAAAVIGCLSDFRDLVEAAGRQGTLPFSSGPLLRRLSAVLLKRRRQN